MLVFGVTTNNIVQLLMFIDDCLKIIASITTTTNTTYYYPSNTCNNLIIFTSGMLKNDFGFDDEMLLDHFASYYKYPCLILWYNIPLPQAIWCPELRAIMKINMNLLWQLHWLQGSRRDIFKQQRSTDMIDMIDCL